MVLFTEEGSQAGLLWKEDFTLGPVASMVPLGFPDVEFADIEVPGSQECHPGTLEEVGHESTAKSSALNRLQGIQDEGWWAEGRPRLKKGLAWLEVGTGEQRRPSPAR